MAGNLARPEENSIHWSMGKTMLHHFHWFIQAKKMHVIGMHHLLKHQKPLGRSPSWLDLPEFPWTSFDLYTPLWSHPYWADHLFLSPPRNPFASRRSPSPCSISWISCQNRMGMVHSCPRWAWRTCFDCCRCCLKALSFLEENPRRSCRLRIVC